MSEGLIKKMVQELEIRNFSKSTIKSYLNSVSKYLEYSKNKGVNENSAREFIQREIKIKNPSTVSHQIFAIQFFFNKICCILNTSNIFF